MAASTPQQERQGSRRKRELSNNGQPEYPQARRILEVLELLCKSGPQTPEALAAKTGVVYRTIARFMNALQEAGWGVYMRKDAASAKGLWALDRQVLLDRFRPTKRSQR